MGWRNGSKVIFKGSIYVMIFTKEDKSYICTESEWYKSSREIIECDTIDLVFTNM